MRKEICGKIKVYMSVKLKQDEILKQTLNTTNYNNYEKTKYQWKKGGRGYRKRERDERQAKEC